MPATVVASLDPSYQSGQTYIAKLYAAGVLAQAVTGVVELSSNSAEYPVSFTGLAPNTAYTYKLLAGGGNAVWGDRFTTDGSGNGTGLAASALVTPTVTPSGGSLVVSRVAVQAIGDTGVLLGVAVSGGIGPYTYQWHVTTAAGVALTGSTAIAGATSSQLIHTPTRGVGWFYKCVVTDAVGASVTSAPRLVRLGTYPTPLTLPADAPPTGTWHVLYIGDSTGNPGAIPLNVQAPGEVAVDLVNRLTPLSVTLHNFATPGATTAAALGQVAPALESVGAVLDPDSGVYTLPAGVNVLAVVRSGLNDARTSVSAASYKTALANIAQAVIAAGGYVVIDYPTCFEPGVKGSEFSLNTLVAYQVEIDSLVNGTTIHGGDKTSFWETALLAQILVEDELHQSTAGTLRMGLADAIAIVKAVCRIHDAKLAALAARNPLPLAGSQQLATVGSGVTTMTTRLTATRAAALDSVAPIKAKTDLIGSSNADSPRMVQAATDAGSAATNALTAAAGASTAATQATTAATASSAVQAKLPTGGQKIAGVDDVQQAETPPSNRTITINNRTITT